MTEEQVNAQQTESEMQLSRGAGPHEEGGVRQVSEYCKDLLMRGREELSLEELRAERYFRGRQKDVEERLKHLTEVKEQLNQELEEKTRMLLLRKSHQLQVGPEAPPAASFQIYDDSQSPPARPAGNSELQDDVFLRPDERGLCLKVQFPRPGAVGPPELPQHLQTEVVCCSESGDPQTPPPDSIPQEPVSKSTKKLSPIPETSVEPGRRSPLDQHQEVDQDQTPPPVGGAWDPCDPEVRRQLLDVCDVTSSPGFHCESRPLPPVCGRLQLGGDVYNIYCTVLDGGSFSVYKAASDGDHVLIKVDRCRVPWDFHQLTRLKTSAAAAALPLISCFLFLDGCVTVYTRPPDHMFTALAECDSSVVRLVVLLLQLVSQLHSSRLLHAALQPSVLTCSYRGLMDLAAVFPVDWSWSVDLDLQDVTSVQQLPSARTYVSLGLLEPTAPPQLVDLVGVAETVHVLLTRSRMVLVKDAEGWTAERFRDESCDGFPGTLTTWSRFFRSLLNAGARSSLSVLSELTDQLTDHLMDRTS